MGTDVRSGLSLFSLLHADLPESTPLACPKNEAGRYSLYPEQKCLPSMQRSGGPAGDGRFPYGGRYHEVWAQVDQSADSFFPGQRTAGGGLLAPVVLQIGKAHV